MADAPKKIETNHALKTNNTHVSHMGEEHISLTEIHTLMAYVIRHGLGSGENNSRLQKLMNTPNQNNGEPTTDDLLEYFELCKQTAPVNGRTLIQTKKLFPSKKRGIIFLAFLVFIPLLFNEILELYYQKNAESMGVLPHSLALFHEYIFKPLSPYLWGALGSCVFLMKKLSDLAQEGSFSIDKLHGWKVRVMIGALLGGTAHYLIAPESLTAQGLSLNAKSIAFFTGLGAKWVYSAMIESIQATYKKFAHGVLSVPQTKKTSL